MSLKTIGVSSVVDLTNGFLAIPTGTNHLGTEVERQAQRWGHIAVVESVLWRTGNYKGFRYLASEYLPTDEQTDGNVLRPGHDETRRHYHA